MLQLEVMKLHGAKKTVYVTYVVWLSCNSQPYIFQSSDGNKLDCWVENEQKYETVICKNHITNPYSRMKEVLLWSYIGPFSFRTNSFGFLSCPVAFKRSVNYFS